MRRCVVLALLGLIVAGSGCGRAATREGLVEGNAVQIETTTGRVIEGTLVDHNADTVVVLDDEGLRTTVPRADVAKLEVTDRATDGSSDRPSAPQFREITVPAGTVLAASLTTAVASDASALEDPVRATIEKPIVIDGVTAVPERSELIGSVTAVERAGKVKGRARVAFRFDTLKPAQGDESYAIRTRLVTRRAPGTKRQDAAKIVLPAAGGAIIGGLAGGKKGAVIGTAVGGGAGTAVVMSTRGREIRLAPGSRLELTLEEPIRIKISWQPAAGSGQ